MKPNNNTKQKVMDAACRLFFVNGYHGTSVRDIANKAAVNVSLINYYFKSKQGLLEAIVVFYYEEYLDLIESTLLEAEESSSIDKLKKIIEVIIQYKQGQHQFTCFIQRELSLDSTFVREMTVTYLAKENYLISEAFQAALKGSGHTNGDQKFLYFQLKGMLNTPFVTPTAWQEQLSWDQSHRYFIAKYTRLIHRWIDHVTGTEWQHHKGSAVSFLS